MIRIVVDSSADYKLSEITENHLELVPISVTIGDKSYRDGIDLDRDAFYEILEETGLFPKTSQPSPQAFLNLFKDAKEKGDDVICILLSSELSGTCSSAHLAKQMAEYDRIHIIDSLAATYVIKVMVDYACRLRRGGAMAEDIVTAVENLKSRVKVVAALDTLEYLSRGGRLSKAAAAIGEMANLKPIITLTEDGKVGVVGKCLGRNKALSQLVKQMNGYPLDKDFPLYSLYSYGTDNCGKMEERMIKEGFRPQERLQIGSTIGAHIGPGAFGMIYVIAE